MRTCQDFSHVVVGIIKNTANEVVVTKRKSDAHLGGLLEFPGGKLEANETPKEALQRELKEELDIHVHQCLPLVQVPYTYPEKSILLDVYTIVGYSGSILAKEGQKLTWRGVATLNYEDFPAANYAIIRAIQLPNLISVTPRLNKVTELFLQHFEKVIKKDTISIIQLRCHELSNSKYIELAEHCAQLCKQYRTKLILNREVGCLEEINAAGLHLTSKRLAATSERPSGRSYLIGASCHNLDDLLHASQINLDYAFLGPVLEKNTNVSKQSLGWNKFHELVKSSRIPVYAIGGLVAADVNIAIRYGGQGVAAIRDLWSSI